MPAWLTMVSRSAGLRPSVMSINGLFQVAKHGTRAFTRITIIKRVIFLIAENLGFHAINPHAVQDARNSKEPPFG
jgi:hypothetical protein